MRIVGVEAAVEEPDGRIVRMIGHARTDADRVVHPPSACQPTLELGLPRHRDSALLTEHPEVADWAWRDHGNRVGVGAVG